MAVDALRFRRVLSHFAAGVTVITVLTPAGMPLGFTATAFSSLSLTPPLALVCASKGKPTHAALLATKTFGVNILAADQEDLARRFADPRVTDRFAGLGMAQTALGLPMLDGTVAGIECVRAGVFDGGDHSIIIGRVEDLWHTDALPLLHFAGHFAELGREGPPLREQYDDWLVGAPW